MFLLKIFIINIKNMFPKYNDLIYHCKECPFVPKIGIVHENNEIYVEY